MPADPHPTAVPITRGDGLVDTAQAALLCGVRPGTIRQWVLRGQLRVAKQERGGRRNLYDPVDLAKAEYATRRGARRTFGPPQPQPTIEQRDGMVAA